MKLYEKVVDVDTTQQVPAALRNACEVAWPGESIVRCVMRRDACEVGVVSVRNPRCDPLAFASRPYERQNRFTVAVVVPTGVGAEQGGHAGDATPALKMIAQVADTVITHPNVVNASDLIDIPADALYV